jgi:tetratricopeptide (TPR) repeat protein
MTTGPDATFDDEERRYFETLKDWISRQQADGIPLGRIEASLWESASDKNWLAGPLIAAAGLILDIFITRSASGAAAERGGNLGEAIDLYEANVKDEFIGSHPYERLFRIYFREGRLDDAERVCRAFLALPRAVRNQREMIEEFLRRIAKQRGHSKT